MNKLAFFIRDILGRAAAAPVEGKVSDVLKRGRKRIARGWVQGKFVARSALPFLPNSYCASGAILCGVPGDLRLKMAACRVLNDVCDSTVASFNDAPGRTKDEVLALYDKAIELAEKREAA